MKHPELFGPASQATEVGLLLRSQGWRALTRIGLVRSGGLDGLGFLHDLVAQRRIDHQFPRDLDGVGVGKDGDHARDYYGPDLDSVLVPTGYAIHRILETVFE